MTPHVFADESKARGFLLAAAVVLPGELAPMRNLVRTLRLPGQRRIHCSKESDRPRKVIVGAMAEAGARVVLYDASRYRDEKAARDAAIASLAYDVAKMGAARLVIERDDSVVEADRKIIRTRLIRADCHDTLSYEHARARQEYLLAIPNAVAWCWAKGGHWRCRVAPS